MRPHWPPAPNVPPDRQPGLGGAVCRLAPLQEAGDLMGLTARQLRTREARLQRAIDHFGLGWKGEAGVSRSPAGAGLEACRRRATGDLRRVAARLGVCERMLYRFLHEMDEVDIDVVDRVLCNAGTSTTLCDLYPHVYDNA